jgi:hypothetical protein
MQFKWVTLLIVNQTGDRLQRYKPQQEDSIWNRSLATISFS